MRKLKAFKCEDCQHEFERLVDNGEIPECPSCHSNNTRFCYSSLAIKVNGIGQYSSKMKI